MGDTEILTNGTTNGDHSTTNTASPPAPLTKRQAELIVNTWKLVKVDLQGAGIILFEK